MGGCAALNCSNHSRNGIRMARIPIKKERREKWLINMRRKNWVPGRAAQICIGHFDDSQFEFNRGQYRLKVDAVPTLFNFPDKPYSVLNEKRLKETGSLNPNSTNCKITAKKSVEMGDSLSPGNAHVVRIIPVKSEDNSSLTQDSEVDEEQFMYEEESDSSVNEVDKEQFMHEEESDSSIDEKKEENDPLLKKKLTEEIIPKTEFVTYFVCNSDQQITNLSQDLPKILASNNIAQKPSLMSDVSQIQSKFQEVSKLLDNISNLENKIAKYHEQREKDKRKIKTLMQAQRRHQKTIAALKTHLNVLKNRRDDHTKLEIIKNLCPSLLEHSDDEECQNDDEPISEEYSLEVKEFAKNLYSISPDAYKYVCNYSDIILPSEETILKWLHSKNDELNFSG